jgi:AcrR family transcriptional regulator
MPKNRRPQPHDEKRAELVAAAAALFLTHGYDKTSIGKIAQAAGVAPNTIYWYFDDKDALLVATADGFLASALSDYASVMERSLVDQMAWLVDRLRPFKDLMSTIHQRASQSEHVATWHTDFHATVEQLFEAQLPAPLDPATREADVTIVAFTLEGIVTHDVGPQVSRAVYEALVDRAMAASGGPQRETHGVTIR